MSLKDKLRLDNGRILGAIARVTGASVINKIVSFLSNVIVVRIVTQYEYGLYSSANNIITMAMLFTGLGTISGVLQYGAENREDSEKERYFKYCIFIGIIVDILITAGICAYAGMNLMPIYETKKYIFLLSPTIILQYLFEYFGAILRSRKSVKEYARLLNVNSISFSVFSVAGTYAFGVTGLAIGRSLSYVLGIMMGLRYTKEVSRKVLKSTGLKSSEKRELLRYSIACCISSALNRLLYVIDVSVISYVIKDAALIAVYRVGTTIPEALEFIPQSILIAVLPYFAENNNNIPWLKKSTRKLYLTSGALNAVLTVLLVLLAPFIVTLLWGSEYEESIPIFICLSINYFIMATFRQNGTNILTALRKTNYNVMISIITCISNVILDIIFVKKMGIMGAAIATILVVTIASVLSFPYVYYLIYTKKGQEKLYKREQQIR